MRTQNPDDDPGVKRGLQHHLVLRVQGRCESLDLFHTRADAKLPSALPIRSELADLQKCLVYIESVEHAFSHASWKWAWGIRQLSIRALSAHG